MDTETLRKVLQEEIDETWRFVQGTRLRSVEAYAENIRDLRAALSAETDEAMRTWYLESLRRFEGIRDATAEKIWNDPEGPSLSP